MPVLILVWCLTTVLWIDVVYEIYFKIRKRQKMLQKAITLGNVMNDAEFRNYCNLLSLLYLIRNNQKSYQKPVETYSNLCFNNSSKN